MIMALAYGFYVGDLSKEGEQLMAMPWGIITIIDVYVGILFFSAWVWYREQYAWISMIWIVSFICLGNFATAIYLLKAVLEAKGNLDVISSGYRTAG